MTVRRIAVVTGTRADYGLLYWLLRRLRDDASAELQLVVTGTHLSERFGHTVRQIQEDGFRIAARLPLPLDDDSPSGVTRCLGEATIGFGATFDALRPDLLVLLGDRYEVLAAAQAALLARVPVAHLHGGEATEGAVDESIRHAVTKMSHLHFVAAEPFRRRVIQLGEAPERVWVVGALGLDNIERLPLLGRAELEAALGIRLRRPTFLVTYHPPTLSVGGHGRRMRNLLQALESTAGSIVLTGVNADAGHREISEAAQSFASAHPGRVILTPNLGSLLYLSVMAQSDVVIGNSSSGLIEAPALGVPTVDIGDRQRGRLRALSVIHCEDDSDAIASTVARALGQEHKNVARRLTTPYGTPGAAERIAPILASYPLDSLTMKHFHDWAGSTS